MLPFSRLRALSSPLGSPWRLALILALWLPGPLLPAQQPGDSIRSVQIEGLAGYRPEQILSRLETQADQSYQPLTVQDDLTELSKIMRTATVTVDAAPDGGVNVIFRVTEFPRLRQWQAIGNDRLKTERIGKLLDLKAGETLLDENQLESIRRALLREYRALGQPQATVQAKRIDWVPAAGEAPAAFPQADLQIVIDEGRQVRVDDVVLHGNQAFSGMRLRAVMQTNGSWLFVKNYYDDATYEDDLNKLRDFYAANGYFDARIRRGIFEERTEGGKTVVSPVVEIEEGERYRLGSVVVRGARLYSQAEVIEPFAALLGKPFDGRGFAQALQRLQSLYSDHGLLNTEIDPVYEYDTPNRLLNMRLDIKEGGRIYVGKVRVIRPAYEDTDEEGWFRGWYDRLAPPVLDETIEQEILLEPGAIYNRRLEQDSVRRLARLGVFEEGTLKAYNQPTADPAVQDMVVEVAEGVTGSLNGGVGFGDANGAFIYASFNERNVGGRADILRVGGTVGTRYTSFSVSYLKRHLGDTRDSLLSQLYYNLLLRPGYRATVAGSQLEWGHPLAAEWTRFVGARLEAVKMSERDGIDAAEELDRLYPVATAHLRFEQDTRDPAEGTPREGYLQSFGVEMGYAGGPLVKFDALRDQYRPLTERLTWRLYTEAGMMPASAGVVPINERYFLGGNTDMRGFDFRGAGYFDRKDDEVPIGGAAKLLAKNELIFPLFQPVSGVLFADVGGLGESPLSWQVPRVSTGAGVRFDMQRVQVGLDLALPLVTQTDDQTRFFHFSLQSRF